MTGAVPTSQPSSGSLAEQPLAELVYRLAVGGFTGSLVLEQDAQRCALWFAGGQLVDADSSVPEDQIGRVLLDAAVADQSQVAAAAASAAAQGRDELAVLLEMGVLDAEKAQRVASLGQVRRSLRGFGMPAATFLVQPGEHTRRAVIVLDPRWLVYRGLRYYGDQARFDRELARLQGMAIKARAQEPDAFGFGDEERLVLAYLAKGFWELGALVEACPALPSQQVCAVVLALLSTSRLEIRPAAEVPRLRKRPRDGAEAGSGVVAAGLSGIGGSGPVTGGSGPVTGGSGPVTVGSGPVTTSSGPVTGGSGPVTVGSGPVTTSSGPCARPGGTSPAAGVSGRASAGGFVHAVRSVESPLAGDGEATPAPAAPGGSGATAAAPSAGGLGSGGSSQPNEHPVAAAVAAKLAQIEAGADLFTLLEVDREATSAQVKTAFFQHAKTFHPDRLAGLGLQALRPNVERVFTRMNEAFATLSDDAKRKAYLAVLGKGGEAAVKKKEEEEAAQAMKILAAEESFHMGEMALRREHFPQALECFRKAVEQNPGDPGYQAALAWATWGSAADKAKVATEVRTALQKVIEQDEKCAEAYLYLAQVVKHLGQVDRAYGYFRKVLTLRPNNIEAQREVRLIEMRRKSGPAAAGGEKKGGLFDRFRKK